MSRVIEVRVDRVGRLPPSKSDLKAALREAFGKSSMQDSEVI